jgi:hypothetical protein
MIGTSLRSLSLGDHKRKKRNRVLEIIALEGRCLLSISDMIISAIVEAITNGAVTVEPVRTAYAINAGSVQVNFAASDPDQPGVTPTIHYNLIDLTAQQAVSGTGSSISFSAAHEYQVQYWATDADDSQSAGFHSIMIAIDRTPPTVIVNPASSSILWPPDGKFVTVTITGTAIDDLSGVNPASLRFAVADEYGKVQPAGAIVDVSGSDPTAFGGFEIVNFSFQVNLQARRFGYDFDGRQYLLGVSAFDAAGNVGTGGTVVTVPHDMGHHGGNQNGGDRGSNGQQNGSGNSGGDLGGNGSAHGHGNGHGKGHGASHGKGQGSSSTGEQGGSIGTLPNQGNGKGNQGHGNGNGNQGHGNGNQGHGNGNENGNGNQGHGNGQGH